MDFCGVVMPSQKDNILQFNISSQITYHTLFMQKFNFWLKKNRWKWIQFRQSSPRKKGVHIPYRYSISTILAFDKIENN